MFLHCSSDDKSRKDFISGNHNWSDDLTWQHPLGRGLGRLGHVPTSQHICLITLLVIVYVNIIGLDYIDAWSKSGPTHPGAHLCSFECIKWSVGVGANWTSKLNLNLYIFAKLMLTLTVMLDECKLPLANILYLCSARQMHQDSYCTYLYLQLVWVCLSWFVTKWEIIYCHLFAISLHHLLPASMTQFTKEYHNGDGIEDHNNEEYN